LHKRFNVIYLYNKLMDKKRENVLFPLGFNSLPITALAYNLRIKTEIKNDVEQKLAEMKAQLESDFNSKLEIIRKDFQDQMAELREKIRKHDDDWENVEEEKK